MKLELELTDAEHFVLFMAMGAWRASFSADSRPLADSYANLLEKLVKASTEARDSQRRLPAS